MNTFKEIAGMIALWLLAVFGLGALFAALVMWLWNQVVPELFGLKEITLWQALCLSWLSAVLFKSMTPASSKSDDNLDRIERLLDEIKDLHGLQVSALDDVKGSLDDVTGLLEKQR